MKTLSIHGRRWFQKGPGNTYHSAYAIVDGNRVEGIGYAYGYGNQFEDSMFRKLESDGLLPTPIERYSNGGSESAFRYCERNRIAYPCDVIDVPRKKDL